MAFGHIVRRVIICLGLTKAPFLLKNINLDVSSLGVSDCEYKGPEVTGYSGFCGPASLVAARSKQTCVKVEGMPREV